MGQLLHKTHGNPEAVSIEAISMSFWQLYYHIVTATIDRLPLLTADIEPIIYRLLREKAYNLGGTVYAIGGVEDHVHLVVSIPPRISVASFIGQVKGYASAQFNRFYTTDFLFQWQSEYGVFSFDKKRLPDVTGYVARQKDHHQQSTLIALLERTEEDAKKISEDGADYLAVDFNE